jgi:hypothetical protein
MKASEKAGLYPIGDRFYIFIPRKKGNNKCLGVTYDELETLRDLINEYFNGEDYQDDDDAWSGGFADNH